MDTITIKSLKVPTIIGVYPHERQIKQNLVLNIDFKIDASLPAKEDDLNQTVDYDALTAYILEFGQSNAFKLIETFGVKLIESCLEHFPIEWIKLNINKRHAITQAECVAITLERGSL